MNREILFRGKDENGNWHQGTAMLWNGHAQIIKHCHMVNSIWKTESVRVINKTVGQLWIVNNVRLFGGDLFKATCSISGSNDKSTKICKVVDSDQGFSVSVWHNGEWWAYSFIDFTTIKLIGNIHDNPNLLTDVN